MSEKILVTRSSMPPIEEYFDEIRELWDSHWLTNMGVKHRELESILSEYLGVEYVSLMTNGHLALENILQAMDLSGEVITTPFTFASTTNAIVRNGLKPVFCDIKEDDYTIDPDKIEALITDKTCAILPVHVYGNICDTEKIQRIADKYGLKVIYDAAHAFGERYMGKGIGTYGDASMFSFHATKVFNTIEGGAAVFKSKELYDKIAELKNFGICSQDCVKYVGGNAKMNEFQAAMGICNMRHIDEELEKRRMAVERYRERLGNADGIKLSPVREDVVYNYAYFPVVFDKKKFGADRDEIADRLARNDIIARKYFYPLTNSFESFHGEYDVSLTPIAADISNNVLTLPLYADLTVDVVDKICNLILESEC